MLDVRIVMDDVPEYIFKACGATTQDERDTISACVRTYARDCINATLLTIEDGPVFKDAWRYRRAVRRPVRAVRTSAGLGAGGCRWMTLNSRRRTELKH